MIRLSKDSKVYVLCPEKVQTGGTELAHQLVDYLRSTSLDAYIVYINEKTNSFVLDSEITEGFNKYNVAILNEPIIDNAKNILVLPEVYFQWAKKNDKLQYVFWWMSIDFYYQRASILEALKFKKNPYYILRQIYSRIRLKRAIFKAIDLKYIKRINNNSLHVYQSEYAHNHLINRGISDLLPLGDYINTELKGSSNSNIFLKENIILYNPAKGLAFTKKIIYQMSDCSFIPLKGLTRDNLRDLFQRAKLYIDFGNHPGKDRLPREAALHDCCVITGRHGAANYFEDIPIPERYKFQESSISDITFMIRSILNNYEEHILDYQFYKERILLEESKFYSNINEIFKIY